MVETEASIADWRPLGTAIHALSTVQCLGAIIETPERLVHPMASALITR
jgi:hypothetical protein